MNLSLVFHSDSSIQLLLMENRTIQTVIKEKTVVATNKHHNKHVVQNFSFQRGLINYCSLQNHLWLKAPGDPTHDTGYRREKENTLSS